LDFRVVAGVCHGLTFTRKRRGAFLSGVILRPQAEEFFDYA